MDTMIPAGTVLQDRYEIEAVLGCGGECIFYAAKDSRSNADVVINELFPGNYLYREPGEKQVHIRAEEQTADFEKMMKNFLHEAERFMIFAHCDNIASVWDCFRENGTAYIVKERLKGSDLSEYLRACGGRVPCEEVVSYAKCVISALRTMHGQHVIHRNICPNTIFICADGTVRVSGLDAALFMDEPGARNSQAPLLMPGYSPQEQYLSKEKQGLWTDIYALGAVMYRAVTGMVPTESVERSAGMDGLAEPISIVPEMPEYLNQTIVKCMEIQPKRRFQNVDEMERWLDRKKGKKKYLEKLKIWSH